MAITQLHHHLGKLCPDHVVSTRDNDPADSQAFDLLPLFSTGPSRYIPYAYQQKLKGLARRYDVQNIICEHPYMALSAHRLARSLHIPWYLRAHNIESERFRSLGKPWWRILARYEQWAMERASGTLFLTQEDAEWAQQHFAIPGEQCHFLPFGTVMNAHPGSQAAARKSLAELWNIDPSRTWIYFLGALAYRPNEEAVEYIINEIAPRLRQQGGNYQLLIGGKGLSSSLQQQVAQTSDIRYVGFIPVLDDFLNACDVMVNPVMKGGGVKTKAVEALGYNKMVVSTRSGAAGLLPALCGDNLLLSHDEDWDGFCAHIRKAAAQRSNVPQAFYETYYWGNIARKAVSILSR